MTTNQEQPSLSEQLDTGKEPESPREEFLSKLMALSTREIKSAFDEMGIKVSQGGTKEQYILRGFDAMEARRVGEPPKDSEGKPHYMVKAKIPQRRRAGYLFGMEPRFFTKQQLTEEQVKAIEADDYLKLKIIG